MTYIKISDIDFKEVKSQEIIYNIPKLKRQKEILLEQKNITGKKIEEIDALLLEAEKLGIKITE